MGFGYGNAFRNSGIRRLLNYNEAKWWHDNTKPIRTITKKDGTTNANAGVRPLGHRNRAWFQIKMGEGDSVICSAYRDEIQVKFTKDGEIHIKNSQYISNTAVHFFDDVLGSGWWSGIEFVLHDHAIKVEVRRLDGEMETHRLGSSETMKLKLHNKTDNPNDHTNRWEVLTPNLTLTHTVNRQAMKEVKARYDKIYDFARQYCKLLGDEVVVGGDENDAIGKEFDGFRLYGGWYGGMGSFASATDKLYALMQGDDNREVEVAGFIRVIKAMAYVNGQYYWKNSSHSANYDKIKEALDIVVMGLHRDDVLHAKVDETGRRRDRYGFLYRKGWAQYHKMNTTNA